MRATQVYPLTGAVADTDPRDKVMTAIQELQRLLREEGTSVTDTQAEAIARRVSKSVEAYLAHRRQPRPTSRPLVRKAVRAVA